MSQNAQISKSARTGIQPRENGLIPTDLLG
jgi:hypothetical protein